MLGHTEIRTTQIYAKILDNKVADDMAALERKLQKALTNSAFDLEVQVIKKTAGFVVEPDKKLELGIKSEARIVKLFR